MAAPAPSSHEVTEGDQVPAKLWMGDLEPYMDEAFLVHVFSQYGFTVSSYKWIRNHLTGTMARYCFLEFDDLSTARAVLETLNNQTIPETNGSKRFKLNWASRKLESGMAEYNVFVADLSKDVTSQQLLEYFQRHYKSVRFAKVVEDDIGISKGYGFVRFCDEAERNRAFEELDNCLGLGTKPIRVKAAYAPKQKPSTETVGFPASSVPTTTDITTTASSSSSISSPGPVMDQSFNPYPHYLPMLPPPPPNWPLPVPPFSPHQYPVSPFTPYGNPMDNSPLVYDSEGDVCVDPDAGPSKEEQNSSLFTHDKELFLQMDATRWRLIDSVSTKLD